MAWRADLRERSVEGRGYRDPGRRSWLDRLLWSDPLRQARSRQSIHPETRGHAAPCNLCAQLIRYLSAWSDSSALPREGGGDGLGGGDLARPRAGAAEGPVEEEGEEVSGANGDEGELVALGGVVDPAGEDGRGDGHGALDKRDDAADGG